MNKNLLEYEIKKNGFSISEFCEKVGISRSAFYRKCTEKTQFTQAEIKTIIEVLNLDSPMEIFFAKQVS